MNTSPAWPSGIGADPDFLSLSYLRNWELFTEALRGAGNVPHWDLCVLTAAGERQAHAYRLQLDMRRKIGALPPNTDFLVVPDPGGAKVGSGGATLNVLLEVLKSFAPGYEPGNDLVRDVTRILRNRRILVVHSGGDSKRLPQYSAYGKLFARVPRELPDGRASTLFDEFLVSLSGIPLHMHEGVVITSGDVLLVFDHSQLDLSRQGVVGVAMRVAPETGTRHGVYVPDPVTRRVRLFLHKPDLRRLENASAIGSDGRVAVDTGIVWMDPEVVGRCVAMAGTGSGWAIQKDGLLRQVIDEQVPLNLYGDIIGPLAQETDASAYLADTSDAAATAAMQRARQTVWDTLRGVPLSIQSLHPARFVHFGSTLEYRHAMQNGAELFGGTATTHRALSHVSRNAGARIASDVTMSHTLVCDIEGRIGRGTVVENCYLAGNLSIGHGCMVSGIRVQDLDVRFAVRDNLVLHVVPVTGKNGSAGMVARFYGVADNPKLPVDQGYASFMNQSFTDWMTTAGVAADDLWDAADVERTLWNARLFPVCDDEQAAWNAVSWFQQPEKVTGERLNRWRASLRHSLVSSYRQANLELMLDRLDHLEDEIRVHRFIDLSADRARPEILNPILGARRDLLRRRAGLVSQHLAGMNPVVQIHGYKTLSDAVRSAMVPGDTDVLHDAEAYEDTAFLALSSLIRSDGANGHSVSVPAKTQVVRAWAPARLDFGGGWSDTPPYSIECGGTVLNAAVTLNGSVPILAEAAFSDDGLFHLESHDLGVRRIFRAGELDDFSDLTDPLALHKAALVLAGLNGTDSPGVRLSTRVEIPKGSGLGTSSIMSGVLLAAANRLTGYEPDTQKLFNQVLCLEQMLTTGGGWQDQVGGLVGGIKLIRTEAGLPQTPTWEPVNVPEGLDEHLVLVYTGQRRLAKRILRTIMGKYLSWDPSALAILSEIQDMAREMASALATGDLEEFGTLLSEHWEANKVLDPGSTNSLIDHLFAVTAPYVWGGKLAGAGGGGFAILMTRSPDARVRLATALEEHFPEQGVRIWPTHIHSDGLEVSAQER